MRQNVDILGIPIDNVTMQDALKIFKRFLGENKTHAIYTPNSEIIMAATRDSGLMRALRDADMLIPDGAGVVLGSKILGTPLQQKVSGIDLVRESFAAATAGHLDCSYYLLGGRPGIAAEAADKIRSAYPGVVIAGLHHGYFTPDEEDAIIESINQSRADVLLVGLGAPKQEKWIDKNKDRLNVKICMGIGGSLDVFSGKTALAPEFLRRNGLEWAYRLVKQPWRYKRMADLPVFILKTAARRVSGK